MRNRKTPKSDTFYAVLQFKEVSIILKNISNKNSHLKVFLRAIDNTDKFMIEVRLQMFSTFWVFINSTLMLITLRSEAATGGGM